MCRVDDIVNRVVTRYSSRVIPVDKGWIANAAHDLTHAMVIALERRHPQDQPLGHLAPRYFVLVGRLDNLEGHPNAKGEPVASPWVVVSSVVTKSPHVIVSGASGSYKGNPAIFVNLNGTYTPEQLAKSLPTQKNELRVLLLHEFTHLLDISPKAHPTTKEVPTDLDLTSYYNQPHEVRAYMQEVVDRAVEMAPKLSTKFHGQELIKYVLLTNQPWKDMEPHLTDANKKKVIQAVYSALREWLP